MQSQNNDQLFVRVCVCVTSGNQCAQHGQTNFEGDTQQTRKEKKRKPACYKAQQHTARQNLSADQQNDIDLLISNARAPRRRSGAAPTAARGGGGVNGDVGGVGTGGEPVGADESAAASLDEPASLHGDGGACLRRLDGMMRRLGMLRLRRVPSTPRRLHSTPPPAPTTLQCPCRSARRGGGGSLGGEPSSGAGRGAARERESAHGSGR